MTFTLEDRLTFTLEDRVSTKKLTVSFSRDKTLILWCNISHFHHQKVKYPMSVLVQQQTSFHFPIQAPCTSILSLRCLMKNQSEQLGSVMGGARFYLLCCLQHLPGRLVHERCLSICWMLNDYLERKWQRKKQRGRKNKPWSTFNCGSASY